MERWPEVTEGDGFTTEALRPCREILLRFGVRRSALTGLLRVLPKRCRLVGLLTPLTPGLLNFCHLCLVGFRLSRRLQ